MLDEMKKYYDEVFAAMNKIDCETIFEKESLRRAADGHLLGLELKEKYGFNIDPLMLKDFFQKNSETLNSYMSLLLFKDNISRISFPDDERQPKDGEILLKFCFPSGAYIFASKVIPNDYPKEYFNKFWEELKTYNPKYIDTANLSLYFSLDNAGKICNDFKDIYNRYMKGVSKDENRRRIAQLLKQLEKLESEE